jgi:hypothetical protein
MPNRSDGVLARLMRRVTLASLAGAGVMLAVAAAMRSLGGVRAQVLLTLGCLFFGSLLAGVQLRARPRMPTATLSMLLGVGVTLVFVSQASFLCLVWTRWTAWRLVWRVWWVSMVPSVFVTHLLLLRAAAAGRRHDAVERAGAVCIAWAGAMILWLGLREDLFARVPAAYLWVGAAPAAGTVFCSLYVAVRWLLGHAPVAGYWRRGLVAAVLMSHLVLGVAGFYVGRATARRTSLDDPQALAVAARRDVAEQFQSDRYTAQSVVATALGDTRIIRREPFIRHGQIAALRSRLRPGDILLERRNWYLSNPFLPGFWPHAALYVGDADALASLGVADHPSVRRHLAMFCTPADDGERRDVIEAVSEGVLANSLTHSLHADYAAALRPRLKRTEVARAVVRAFEQLGKPYDFNFDFDDRRKLVCSQVVYVAYEGMLDFPLKRIMGRRTLPAVEIARAYAVRRRAADRPLDFLLFLDGDPVTGTAREAGEEAFLASLDRPRALVER